MSVESKKINEARQGFTQRLTIGDGELSFAVKDTIDVKGLPTCAGSKAFLDCEVASENAHIVTQLLKANYVLKGKTTLHELAFGVTGINSWAGTPVNPKYPKLIPGGSSSGSAVAVANKSVDFAIGTDTGGSVRMPAACCGVIGLKPTYGMISRQGVMPANSSLDCVGFFCRDIVLMGKLLHHIGVPEKPPYEVGIVSRLSYKADPAIEECIDNALAKKSIASQQIIINSFEEAHNAGLEIISHENWQAFGDLITNPSVSEDIRSRLKIGSEIKKEQIERAEMIKASFTKELDKILNKFNFLITPALPALPPTLEEADEPLNFINLTCLLRPFNLSGHPALVIPIGEIADRPVSMQIIAKKHDERNLVEFAKKLLTSL